MGRTRRSPDFGLAEKSKRHSSDLVLRQGKRLVLFPAKGRERSGRGRNGGDSGRAPNASSCSKAVAGAEGQPGEDGTESSGIPKKRGSFCRAETKHTKKERGGESGNSPRLPFRDRKLARRLREERWTADVRGLQSGSTLVQSRRGPQEGRKYIKQKMEGEGADTLEREEKESKSEKERRDAGSPTFSAVSGRKESKGRGGLDGNGASTQKT